MARTDRAQRALLCDWRYGCGHGPHNVYKPLIVLDTLDSLRLLADAMRSFARHCVAGIKVNTARVDQLLQGSLMLVTALAPHIGYDRAAQIAKEAHQQGTTLREAALALGFVTAAQFDEWVDARRMLGAAHGADGFKPPILHKW